MSEIIPNYENTVQLPNILREALLGSGYGKTALLLDLLFVLGYKSGQKVTYNELLETCGIYTANHIIREGLLCFAFKRAKKKSTGKGRPTYEYTIPYIHFLRQSLCGDTLSPTDTLHVLDMVNMQTYRKALHRQLIYRNCSESIDGFCTFSRYYMASRLGLSENTIRAYEKELKIHVKPCFERTIITKKSELAIVPKRKSHDGKMLEAYRRRDEKWINLPADRGIAGLYLKQGYTLTLITRKANKYAASQALVNYGYIDF